MGTKESLFTGGLFGYIRVYGFIFFAITFTASLALPWAMCHRERWLAKHTHIEEKQLEFYGDWKVLFARKILLIIFGPILIGLAIGAIAMIVGDGGNDDINVFGFGLFSTLMFVAYLLFVAWLALRMKKWIVRHTRFA